MPSVVFVGVKPGSESCIVVLVWLVGEVYGAIAEVTPPNRKYKLVEEFKPNNSSSKNFNETLKCLNNYLKIETVNEILDNEKNLLEEFKINS